MHKIFISAAVASLAQIACAFVVARQSQQYNPMTYPSLPKWDSGSFVVEVKSSSADVTRIHVWDSLSLKINGTDLTQKTDQSTDCTITNVGPSSDKLVSCDQNSWAYTYNGNSLTIVHLVSYESAMRIDQTTGAMTSKGDSYKARREASQIPIFSDGPTPEKAYSLCEYGADNRFPDGKYDWIYHFGVYPVGCTKA